MLPSNQLTVRNPRVCEAAKLAQKKFRRQTGCILIEGARLVSDALAAGAPVREVFATAAFAGSAAGQELHRHLDAARRCSPVRTGEHLPTGPTPISDAAAAKLSETRTPQGVFAVVEFTTASFDAAFSAPGRCSPVRTGEHLSARQEGPAPAQKKCPPVRTGGHLAAPLVLLADNIADPGNLGTMIRSAAALGASGVVAAGDSCDVLNPKTVRATMGAIFRLPVVADVALPAAIDMLKGGGIRIIAAVPRRGKAPWELDLRGATALLIGSEAAGLHSSAIKLADARVTVPMPGGTESLNAAATAAALLYEAARQRAGVT